VFVCVIHKNSLLLTYVLPSTITNFIGVGKIKFVVVAGNTYVSIGMIYCNRMNSKIFIGSQACVINEYKNLKHRHLLTKVITFVVADGNTYVCIDMMSRNGIN